MLIKDKSLYMNLFMAGAFYFGAGVFAALAFRHWQQGDYVTMVLDALIIWVDVWVAHKAFKPVAEHLKERRDGQA